MLVVDRSGHIRTANDRTTDLFGYTPAEVEGEPIERLVPAAVREDHVALRESCFDDPTRRPTGAGLDLEAERSDGSTFPVDVSLSPLTIDGDVHVLATVRDVTAHQNVRRKYRTLLETIPDAVVVADVASGEIIEVNERATRLFGRTRADLLGSHQSTLHPAGQAERYERLFERHADDDVTVLSTFPDGDDVLVETDGGESVPVEINAQTTRLSGQPVIIGVFRNVSDRRAHERGLERQIDRVETLASILSHDLRGPLNVAEGYVDQVRTTGDLDSLEAVDDAHDRMAEIIDDALTTLRETGEPHLERVELAALARECWTLVTAGKGSLTVVDDVVVEADPRQLRHVLENLFRNAVVHGGDDVTVRVGVLDRGDGLFVEDDGPGIPADEREHVFEPGYSTHREGTGFGLVIVREVASAHGWNVAVTEGSDGGARFELGDVTFRDGDS